MKQFAAVGVIGMLAGSLIAAYAGPKEDIQAAAKKLGDDSYSWKTTVKVQEGGFGGGTTEGKYVKDGTCCVSMTMRDNTTMAFKKGEKGAVKTDDGWKSLEELTGAGGGGGQPNPGMFMARNLRTFKAPAAQAEDLLAGAKEFKEAGGACVADMTEDGAKKLLARPARAGGAAPTPPKGAKGSVKFWLKDGALVKYEFNVQGTVTGRNDQEQQVDRTTTVEIKDIGSTKLDVPAEVKSKL